MSTEPKQPHSAEYFGKERNFWWNEDFLALLKARIAFPEARSLLDVGCGKCHWTAIATTFFPGLERIVGVDFETTWVQGARDALAGHLSAILDRPDRPLELDFVAADAHCLPFPDATFDVVTCQTVLMHLARPEVAVAEMFRVVRPGGIVLLAEPENSLNFHRLEPATAALTLDELTARYRFWTATHLARKRTTGSDFDLGHRLTALLVANGAIEPKAYVNDRANAMAPPFSEPHQQAFIASERAWMTLLSTDSPTRHTYTALARESGLTDAEIDAAIALEVRLSATRKHLVEDQTWCHGGGSLHYIAWGHKPPG
jgi:ubiquinone/menaquinone biosynthesis C-methylase UbiE